MSRQQVADAAGRDGLPVRPAIGPRPRRWFTRRGFALALLVGFISAGCAEPAARPTDPPLEIAPRLALLEVEPGAEQTFYGVVTRAGAPVRGATITLNVYLPAGGARWYIGPPTNADGATTIRFKPRDSGIYFVEVTTQLAGEVVVVNTSFRVR